MRPSGAKYADRNMNPSLLLSFLFKYGLVFSCEPSDTSYIFLYMLFIHQVCTVFDTISCLLVGVVSSCGSYTLNFYSIRGEEFSVLGVKDKMAVWQQKTANSLPAGGGSEAHASENRNIISEADIAKSKSMQPPESPRVMGIASRNPPLILYHPICCALVVLEDVCHVIVLARHVPEYIACSISPLQTER
jgi:hypothetical protein